MNGLYSRRGFVVTPFLVVAAAACGRTAAQPPEQTPPAHAPTPTPGAGASPAGTPAGAALGKIAIVRAGDVWAKEHLGGQERQVTNGGRYSEPRWSPSGDWLTVRRQAAGDPQPHVGVLRADGSASSSVDEAVVGAASWSPATDRLAFTTAASATVLDPDGAHRVEIAGATSVAWSADGQWLAYTTAGTASSPARQGTPPPTQRAGLWLARADGSDARSLLGGDSPEVGGLLLAGWSPDGAHVLVWAVPAGSASIAADGVPLEAIAVSGGPPSRIAEAMPPHADLISWSPDGTRLAFVNGAGRATWERKGLAVATVAGAAAATASGTAAGPQQVSDTDRADLFPAWSPDGQWLAYTSAPAAPGVPGGEAATQAVAQRRIWLMRPDGTAKRPLLEQSAARDERPRWWDDASTVLWLRLSPEGLPQLWLARLDGAEPPHLVAAGLGLGAAAPAADPSWFGFYGYVDWGALYDWWQPSR
jgi:TolB protein